MEARRDRLGRHPRGEGRRPRRGGPPFLLQWAGQERGSRLPVRSTLAVTLVVLAGTAIAAHNQSHRTELGPLAWLLLLIACGLLLLRHRHPVATVHAVVLAVLVYLGAGYPYGPVFFTCAVAAFAAIVTGHRRGAWAAAGLLWGGHALIVHLLYRWLPPSGDHAGSWVGETALGAWMIAILVASELLRARREQWARERRERAAAERRRRDEERLRIARELHDVLAHSISLINVQAGVGLALLDSDPEQARSALSTIKTASGEALGEVRQVLDTLRTPGDAPLAPVPGLGRLPELAEQAAGAGLTVETVVGGTPFPVPQGADLAAFRIVQEALTNVVRHSGSRTATVRIGYAKGRIELTVDDAGPATGDEAGGSGNGLAGMRERAAALGGTVEAGTRAEGGFRVHAVLPLRKPTGPAPEDPEERP